MIEEDLRTELIGEATISSIVGNRVYFRDPIGAQTQSYISYFRTKRARDMVSNHDRIKLILFSKSMSELLTLALNVINFLEGKRQLNSNEYYSLSFLNQVDSTEKLKDGFFWTMLEYEFKETT
jgi:hypothetical protein